MTPELPNIDPELLDPPSQEQLAKPAPLHKPRILLLYGSNRARSYSRLLTEEAARRVREAGFEIGGEGFDAEGLGGVVAAVEDVEAEFFGEGVAPVGAFAGEVAEFLLHAGEDDFGAERGSAAEAFAHAVHAEFLVIGVDRFATGDHVIGTFFETWIAGRLQPNYFGKTLGGTPHFTQARKIRPAGQHLEQLAPAAAQICDGRIRRQDIAVALVEHGDDHITRTVHREGGGKCLFTKFRQ